MHVPKGAGTESPWQRTGANRPALYLLVERPAVIQAPCDRFPTGRLTPLTLTVQPSLLLLK